MGIAQQEALDKLKSKAVDLWHDLNEGVEIR